MSGSLLSTSTASASAQQAVSSAAASQLSSSLSTTSASGNALNSLTSNFNSFLSLLMTQLKNQDPSSPMDTTQFTSELVQFAGVQQQIDSNTSLTQLIQLTQGSEALQASAVVGKQVSLTSTTLPLQNGAASLTYTAAAANQPVTVTIDNAAGQEVRTVSLTAAQAGSNTWSWNGQDDSGNQLADGSYTAAVQGGTGTAVSGLPFTVTGTVTGVTTTGGAVNVQLGTMTTPLSNIQSVM